MDDDPKLLAAKQHVAALKGFYIHAAIFALVMAGLLIANLVAGGPWWVQWPLLGWGIGLLGHAIAVFAPVQVFGKEWEERKIKEMMDKP